VKLGEVAEVFNGKTPAQDEQRNQGHPVLKIKDVGEDSSFVGVFDSFVDDKFFEKYKAKCLKEGDTLILNAAHNKEYVGSKEFLVSSFPKNVIPTGEWVVIRSKSQLLDDRFKHYLLSSDMMRARIRRVVKGIHLYPRDLKSLEIHIPPLEMQYKIGRILQNAEETEGLRAQAVELTIQLAQSIFSGIFGDPWKNPKAWKNVLLGDVCEKIQDGTHFSPKEQTGDGDVPYVTAKNIRPWGIDLTDVIYIPRKVHEKIYKRCDPKKGDVIYIKDGVTAGLAKVNTLDFEFSMLSSIAMIRPKPQVLNPYYLEYYLNHPNAFRRIMKRKAGSAITRLILKEIRNIRIHLPPYDIQQEFSQIVKKIEEVTKAQDQSSYHVGNLFSALMQSAVRGELTT